MAVRSQVSRRYFEEGAALATGRKAIQCRSQSKHAQRYTRLQLFLSTFRLRSARDDCMVHDQAALGDRSMLVEVAESFGVTGAVAYLESDAGRADVLASVRGWQEGGVRPMLALDAKVIERASPPNALKYTHDHSC